MPLTEIALEPRTVRRIPLNTIQSTQWDTSWLEPIRHAIGRAATGFVSASDKHSLRLIRWAGIAGISGGILWILFLGLLQLQIYDVVPDDGFYLSLFYQGYTFEKLLIMPLLLFIYTTAGMLMLQRRLPSQFAYLSLIIIMLGLSVSAYTVYSNYWLGHLLGDGWGDFLFGTWPITVFIHNNVPTLLLVGIGSVLLLMANVRTRVFPTWRVAFLTGTLISIFVLPGIISSFNMIIAGMHIQGSEDLLDQFGLFAGLVSFFGLAWIFLGISLLRTNQQNQDTLVTRNKGKKARIINGLPIRRRNPRPL